MDLAKLGFEHVRVYTVSYFEGKKYARQLAPVKDLSDLEKEIEPTASKTRGVHSAAIFNCLSCLHVEHGNFILRGSNHFEVLLVAILVKKKK